MSAYNGEKYLAEQIDSILAQERVHVELYIRDDGSTDNTRNILAEYAKHHSNIHFTSGINLGCGKSFLAALNNVSGFEYYAFSDQDDYWEKDKLFSAVELVRQKNNSANVPILYYSNLKVADSRLNIIRTTTLEKRVKTLGGEIMRHSLAGCTMLMNAKLREIIDSFSVSDDMLAENHDCFVVMLTYSAGGILICDPQAHILYRQHKDNFAGSPTNFLARIRKEYHNLTDGKRNTSKIARAFLAAWRDDFAPQARKVLEIAANYRQNFIYRLRIIFSPQFRTGDWRLTLLGKVKALFDLL